MIGLTRLLQLASGLLLFYGALPMLSSAGLQPPNVVVWTAVGCVGLLTLSASRAERLPFAGLWVAGVAFALPLFMVSVGRVGAPECPPDHPPLTSSYSCVFPGTPVVVALALVLLVASLAGGVLELRAALRSRSAVAAR